MCSLVAADFMQLAGSSSTHPSSLAPVVLLSLKFPSPWLPARCRPLAVAKQAVGFRPLATPNKLSGSASSFLYQPQFR
jgi:hypothetical protein